MNKYTLISIILTCWLTSCAQNKDHVVTIKTEYGEMVAILYDDTPKHKENFIKLAEENFFDSTLFHRVIKGFMIQGGDPDSKTAARGQRLGNGGPGYTVDAEFVYPKYYHVKGALSAARLGDEMNPSKASSGSQFYIVQGTVFSEEELKIDGSKLGRGLQQLLAKPENQPLYDTLAQLYQSGDMAAYQKKVISLKDKIEAELGSSIEKDISPEVLKAYSTLGGAPHLDGQYSVFGQVIQGLDVIDKIAAVQTGPADRPVEDIRMTVTVEEMSKKKIEKLYGYKYPDTK